MEKRPSEQIVVLLLMQAGGGVSEDQAQACPSSLLSSRRETGSIVPGKQYAIPQIEGKDERRWGGGGKGNTPSCLSTSTSKSFDAAISSLKAPSALAAVVGASHAEIVNSRSKNPPWHRRTVGRTSYYSGCGTQLEEAEGLAYFYSPGGVLRFRSKLEVLHYIEHGRVMKKEDRQKRKKCGPSNAQENTQDQLSISPSPSGSNLDSLRNTKQFVRGHGNPHE